MGYGLDLLAIPGGQMGTKEKMSCSESLPGAPTVGVPTRGPGSQLVNAKCSLIPDVDARGNTVTHGFILVPAAGPYVQQGGVRGHCIILHPECLYKQGERGREAPKSQLGVESVEMGAQ